MSIGQFLGHFHSMKVMAKTLLRCFIARVMSNPSNQADGLFEQSSEEAENLADNLEKQPVNFWQRCLQGFVAVLSLLLACYAFLYFSVSTEALSATQRQRLGPSATVSYPREHHDGFAKQGPDQSGALSLSLGLLICTEALIAAPQIASEITTEAPIQRLSGSLPWRMVSFARKHKLATTAYSGRSMSNDKKRLELLKFHLTEDRPVIVLIESPRGIQHYVLVLGYHAGSIDLYDPNCQSSVKQSAKTIDDNGEFPGNTSYSETEFLQFWRRGGSAGLFTWWYLPLNRIQ